MGAIQTTNEPRAYALARAAGTDYAALLAEIARLQSADPDTWDKGFDWVNFKRIGDRWVVLANQLPAADALKMMAELGIPEK